MSHRATILIVDDIAANRETLRTLFDEKEFHVIDVGDGETALATAVATPPDLIFLDVMMPKMDGFEVCRRIRADRLLAEIPVIMVTATDDAAFRLAGLKSGADDFITKPFNRAELHARARTITRLNRYRRLHDVQAALRDSEKHFRVIFELGPVAIYSCSADGRISDFNRRAVELWGWEPSHGESYNHFCGSHELYDLDGSLIPHNECPMAQVLKGKIPLVKDLEVVIGRRDGSRINAIVNIVPLLNDEGVITGAINCFHDITERRAAELDRQENAQWLRAIYDQAAVGVVQSGINDRRFRRFNQRFCDFLGYTKEEVAELSLPQISHEQDLQIDLENLEKLRNGTIREYTHDKRFIHRNGSVLWASVAVTGIGPPGDLPTSVIAVLLDITERKRLDEHLLQAQKMEALGQFSGGVAHDFNNILTAIGGYTELSLMTLTDNPSVRDHLAAVLRATGRAADLVRQILTFSRQESQERSPIDLGPVITESIKLMRAMIPSTITFDCAISKDIPVVLANANQVHQILMNLGINAWHAMKDKPGRIQISLERCDVTVEYAATRPHLGAGPYLRLSVSDTGSGMDPATLRRIFEPFFTTKPPGEGTGLGLSVVHGIMDSHDGAVTVHSEVGEGTMFSLYFPVHDGIASTPVPQDQALVNGNGEKVLVVDDEELITQMIQKALIRLGYDAECCSDPKAALKWITDDPKRFKLLLTDQTMPGMTGLVLAREIKAIVPTLPVILMTGYSLSLTAERIDEVGIRQLLLKPVTIMALCKSVNAAISGSPPTNNGSHTPYR